MKPAIKDLTLLNSHGFWSAGVSKFASASGIVGSERGVGWTVIRVAVAASIGGTVSELTGGKFANGARTAAYAQLFNDELGIFLQAREGLTRMNELAEESNFLSELDFTNKDDRVTMASYAFNEGYVNHAQANDIERSFMMADAIRVKIQSELSMEILNVSIKATRSMAEEGLHTVYDPVRPATQVSRTIDFIDTIWGVFSDLFGSD